MGMDEGFIQKCREAFNTFDADGSGTIDTQEMKLLLEAIGESPTEEELFRFMAEVDEDGTGEIEFAEFLRAFEKQHSKTRDLDEEDEIKNAFMALGGDVVVDKKGTVERDDDGQSTTIAIVTLAALKELVRGQFSMTINVDKLVESLDKEQKGGLDFEQWYQLFVWKKI